VKRGEESFRIESADLAGIPLGGFALHRIGEMQASTGFIVLIRLCFARKV
jgi:hypothetical protein